MSDRLSEHVRQLIRSGQKIAAIAAARQEGSLSLADAKALVEQAWDTIISDVDEEKLVVVITWRDGLALPNGFVSPGNKQLELYARAPAHKTTASRLEHDVTEKALEFVYGPSWRRGNDDGSCYRVFDVSSTVLGGAEVAAKPWLRPVDPATTMRWCCLVGPGGEFTRIDPTAF